LPDVSNFIEIAASPVRHSKPFPAIAYLAQKSPLPDFRRGPYDLGDDDSMHLICPTCQAPDETRKDRIGPLAARFTPSYANR